MPVTDPYGIEYDSQTQLCDAYGVKQNVYTKRLKRGWTQEQALGITPVPRESSHVGESYLQSCGQYATVTAYRTYKDIDVVFDDGTAVAGIRMHEVKNGLVANPTVGSDIQDHKGNHFRSRQEMFDFYGISESAFDARVHRGHSLAECLEIPTKVSKHTVSYKGVEYASKHELATALGVSYSYLVHRLERGYDIDNVLDPIEDKMQEYVGKQFTNSMGIMCTVDAVYRDARHRTRFDVTFEDGVAKKNMRDVRTLDKGTFSHPYITPSKYSGYVFHGYTLVSLAYVLGQEYNFHCISPEGEEDILSLQEMREYSSESLCMSEEEDLIW